MKRFLTMMVYVLSLKNKKHLIVSSIKSEI